MAHGEFAEFVKRGRYVILRDMEGSQKVFHLGNSVTSLKMGKYAPIPVDALVGLPFGATVRRGEQNQWSRYRPQADSALTEDTEVAEDNRNLAQDNSAQALTPQDIRAMKGRCSGEEVVEALATNSATFASKTKFAQEKYLRKKQQKHVQQVTLLRPTLMDLCETYMKQSRGKVCGLRFDYLSSLLCQADVRPGGRYLVLDNACGLVAASMAQRMAGYGKVYRVFRGSCPDKALQELDLSEAERKVVRQIPLQVLQSAEPRLHEWLQPPDKPADAAEAQKQEARLSRMKGRSADLEDLEAHLLDAVVVVAGEDEPTLVGEALDVGLQRLAPAGRLVVFGQLLQPLANRQGSMRARGDFVDVRLIQLYTREFQVLPQRTHPHMVAEMMLMEGFLLTGSKVAREVEEGDGGEQLPDECAEDEPGDEEEAKEPEEPEPKRARLSEV